MRYLTPNRTPRFVVLSQIILAVAVCWLSAIAHAEGSIAPGWQSIGAVSRPSWDGRVLTFHGTQSSLAISAISDDVVRVRFVGASAFGRDHSYTISAGSNAPSPAAKADIGADVSVLRTASLQVKVQHSPLQITFATAAGEVLDADDPDRRIAMDKDAFRVAKRLQEDEHVYGFGEKTGRLDKRGWKLGGYNYVMWNSDTYSYDSGTDPLYVSVPFFLVLRHGAAHGIFLDNTWRSTFDIGRERQDLLTFGAEGGELNYYFINGPAPKQVLERYTALTGRMPLPPRWSLGYNQCRYSYYPESRVRLLADTFRAKQVPADVIWLDIHYQDNYKPFTWDHKRFPDPKKLVSDLAAQGFHMVCILDPHPKVENGSAPYDSGIAGNHFVKNPDGSVFEGPVWPSNGEVNPGPSAFPDFSRPATREWWGSLYKSFTDIGIAGIWNDMDEPALFDTPTGTLPLDVVFDNEGQPSTHRELHNVYGQLMSRSTYEGLAKLRPNDRPFVLTRASFAGGQRYAAVWPGDNSSDWSSLRQSVSTLLGLGLSGFPFVGSDISGFANPATGELYARWLQAGVFYPFMRSHTTFGTPDKEPWSFGYQFEAINKRTIELRYQLLPYIYNVMHEANETGIPALRPLFLEFPNDEHVMGMDDEFLFGSSLLIAPVLWENTTEREVYLPKGGWYDYWTGHYYKGGGRVRVPVTLETIPMFVRSGGFIFHQPVVQHTGEMDGQPLRVLIAAARESESTLYEDDGKSFDYRGGGFMKRRFHQTRNERLATIDVSDPEGSYRPATRDIVFELWADHEPENVSIQIGAGTTSSELLPHLSASDLAKASRGWTFADGMITVKDKDRSEPSRLTVQF